MRVDAKVVVFQGKIRWYWHLISANGAVLAVSEAYYQRSNANRAAAKLANGLGIPVEGIK